MGVLTDFATANYETVVEGCRRTSLTAGKATQMAADLLTLSPGATLRANVPQGSDRYLYLLSGGITISANGGQAKLISDNTFVLMQEGVRYEIVADEQSESQLISVTAPPNGNSTAKGFCGEILVLPVADQPVAEVPEQKKRKIYLATKDTASTERAHGMIVMYEEDTVTGNHLHPNAESLFVFLSGKAAVTVNGKEVTVGRGQSTFYNFNDKHRLRGADSNGVGFLEFHIPGGYSTIRD